MGLIDRIRDGTYVPDDEPPIVVPGRCDTIGGSAARIIAGDDLLIVVREFLDCAQRLPDDELLAHVRERPPVTGNVRADALLAGVAEYLTSVRELAPPSWTSDPERFLERFWFVSPEPGFRAIALAQTPVALKRRGIFWPARSLARV